MNNERRKMLWRHFAALRRTFNIRLVEGGRPYRRHRKRPIMKALT
jgi:hypothetical protein